jgi:serine/threonine protein kinase/DNA-binding LacI/PurR family transcriptional regulator
MQTDQFIGRRIRDFIIEERIGRGGMAVVYRARQPSVNRDVALKTILLDSNVGDNDEFRRRFEQEANLIASLEHIHILPIYDYGIVDNEVAFLAMRLLRGGTLSDQLWGGAMALPRATEIFTHVARGLGYAHAKGIIHRDLKPSNIMMDDAGNAYLTDFGLAKLVENSLQLTKTGNIVGTPVYMSPEQLRGDPVSNRSDIYSMGVILYHMTTGRPPFDSNDFNMVSVIYHHLEKTPPPPREVNPELPAAVEAVILRALNKDPEDRFHTVEDMATALNHAIGQSITITSTMPAISPIISDKSAYEASTTTLPRPASGSQETQTPSSPAVSAAAKSGTAAAGVQPAISPAPVPDSSSTAPAAPVKTSRRWLVLVGAIVAGLLVLIIAFALLQNQPVEIPPPTVLEGERVSGDSSTPTEQEIAWAQQRLGDNFIAYIACTQGSEYHATQAREMGDFARANGLDYRLYNPDGDKYTQQTMIEQARLEGARAIIICPLDIELIATNLQSAQEAGIPIVYLSSETPENYGGVFLAGDDYRMGLEAGRAGGRLINEMFDGTARVVILDYPDIPSIVNRAEGLVDGLLEIAPDAEVVAHVTGGIRDLALQNMTAFLEEGDVEFDTILSINDAGSYGAVAALEAAGFSPENIIISSVDAEALARDYILDNFYIRASVDIGREQFSRVAINAITKLLAGSTLPETYLVPPGAVITRADLVPAEPEPESTVSG